MPGPNRRHEYDSSLTCNFCGITAERGGETEPCPKRIPQPKSGRYEYDDMVREFLDTAGGAHLKGRSVDRYTDECLALIAADVHPSSPRPCATCQKISARIGEPFWCLRHALEEARRARS